MKTYINIVQKLTILLMLITAWGGRAWAQGALPVKSIEATFSNPSNNRNWGGVTITPHALDASGANVSSVSMTVTGTAALKNPQADLTYDFLGPDDQTSDGAAQTYTFTIDGLPAGSKFDKIVLPLKAVNKNGNNQGNNTFQVNVAVKVTNGEDDTALYEKTLSNILLQTTSGQVHENLATVADQSFKTTTGKLKVSFTISKGTNNPGCYMAFHGLKLICIEKLADVNLLFVNQEGTAYSGDTKLVRYTPAEGGTSVDFGASDAHYDFRNVLFNKANFSGINGYVLENVVLSEINSKQTLTFTVYKEPNTILFSSAPVDGRWTDNTNWFTMRNNRTSYSGTEAARWNRKYLTVTANGVRDDYSLTIEKTPTDVTPTDRGGYWCFVGDENGFKIQNAAYGPDFYFAYLGSNKYAMVHKDAIPENAVTDFTYNDQSNIKDGASKAYIFRIGKSGWNHLHCNNSDFIAWAPNSWQVNDTGSAFKLTLATPSQFNALTEYDVYHVNWTGVAVNGMTIAYAEDSKTFGKRSTANNGDYLIIEKNSPIGTNNFIVTGPVDYKLTATASSDLEGHACKALKFTITDALATTKWTVKVNDEYVVTYAGIDYRDGESFMARPSASLKHLDFTVNAPADKFVWGPVIDTNNRTVTFDVRDKATTLETGLYQLVLKNDADITKANNLITKFTENENTGSHYIYLAPSIYHLEGSQFKFTGAPTYGGESATYVYINKRSSTYADLTAVGGATLSNLAYTYADGEITFSGYGIKNYTAADNQGSIKYEPKEMPAFASGAGPVTFKLTPASLTGYDSYYIRYYDGYTGTARLTYTKPTPTGFSNYGKDELIIVAHGTTFAPEDFVIEGINCTGVAIIEPTATNPGEVRLYLAAATEEYTVSITGDTRDSDRVVYKTQNYASGKTVNVSLIPAPSATDFKTNVTDRFVWGPIIDHEAKTVTFDIRPIATQIVDGWYQIQLLGDEKIADANYRILSNAGNINSVGSYIYVLPMFDNRTSSVLGKFGGVPAYASEASSYFHITRDGNNIRIQSPDGRYVQNDGAIEYGQTTPQSISGWRFRDNKYFQVSRWTAPGHWQTAGTSINMGSNPGHEGPIVASGSGYHEDHYITKVDPSEMYKVYKVQLPEGQSTVKFVGYGNHGMSEVFDNGYFFLDKENPTPTKEQFKFDALTTINSITITPGDGVNTITFSITTPANLYSNTIIHRQHDVYDRLEATSADMMPGSNYIKKGGGMIDQPYAKNFTDAGYNDNDKRIQNTSIFNITQYVKPGERTECVLPFTKNKSTAGHVEQYQRWYNYETERPFDDEIVGSTISSFNKFTNGHCNYNTSGNKQYNVLGKAGIKLPVGTDTIQVAVDASEFQDTKSLSNGNLMEPSLNMRVIYHIISAHEMAKKLTLKGSGDTWWEEKSYYVPNVKRGSDTYKNNADLLPLDMPFSNYWIYKTQGKVGDKQADDQLMPIIAEDADVRLSGESEAQARARAYTTLGKNLRIEVEGSAAKDLDVGIFNGNPGGIGSAAFINSNHFIYYKVRGSDVTRRLPEGSQAVIKVYAKNGDDSSSPEYQLAKFTLTFQSDCEPLPITSVIGNKESTRSVDYFRSNNLKQVASMTFQEKDHAFTRISSHRDDHNDANTYAFPIDFDRTSYGFSSSYTFGNYSVTRQGWGIKYQPVALYERNIKDPSNTSMSIEDDYFFYIDAAEAPGQVASVPLEGMLCPGTRLYCYGWLGSGNAFNGGSDPCGASVIIQLVGHRSNGTEEVLASYLSGTLTDISYDSNGNEMRSLSYARTPSMEKALYMEPEATQVGVWNSIGFSFLVSKSGFDSYEMRIINNCFSTAGGDYSLDDFRIFANPPKGDVDFTTPLCSDKVRHVKVHADYDMLRDKSNANEENTTGGITATYCFIDAEIFDNYSEGDYHIKDMFEIDETGNHNLKPEYNTQTTAVADVINHAFRDALVGSRYVKDEEHPERTDYGYHTYVIESDYDQIPEYAYNDSKNEVIYREQKGDGVRRIVFKEDVIRGEMYKVPAEKGKEETHPAYWPNLRPSRTYYLVFSPMLVDQGLIDEEHTATSVFGIHESCSFFGKFTTKDPLHVILDNADIESDLPIRAVCHGETTAFSFDIPAMKIEKNYPIIDEEYCTSDESVNGQVVPESQGLHHYRYQESFKDPVIVEKIQDLPYDWWFGGKYDETHTYRGTIEAYQEATHPTIRYAGPKDIAHKQDDAPVNLAQAMIDFRFFYPDFGKGKWDAEGNNTLTDADWAEVTKKDYNSDTGYGLLDSEIATIKDFVEKGLLVLHRNTYDMPLTYEEAEELLTKEVSDMMEKEMNDRLLALALKLEVDGQLPLKNLEATVLGKLSEDGRLHLTLEELGSMTYAQVQGIAENLNIDTSLPEAELRRDVEAALRAMTDKERQAFASDEKKFPNIGHEKRAYLVVRALNILSKETVKKLSPEDQQSSTATRQALRQQMISIFEAQSPTVLRNMWTDTSANLTEEERAALLKDEEHPLTPKDPATMTAADLAVLIEDALAKITDNVINELRSDRYAHFTLVPIMPSQNNFEDEPYIFCPEPRGVKLRITSHEPTMLDGFADMTYPEQMKNVPVRLGLQQISETMSSTTKTLRIPVRGLKKAAKDGIKAVKLAENTGYYNNLFLTKTDDPAYKQPNAEPDAKDGLTEAINNDGLYLQMAGTIETMLATYPTSAKPAPNNYLVVKFKNDMRFREGYTYRVGINYMEFDEQDHPTISCYGTMYLDLKVVPEYQKWTSTTGNGDWTNDKNWARADRSELHADNSKAGDVIEGSTDITLAENYPTNAANGIASSFVPMYFTNVLIDNAAPLPPTLYTERETPEDKDLKPASRSSKTFLEGLHSTATPDIAYDMEVIPSTGEWHTDGNYECGLFGTYIAKGITFLPGARLVNAHLLDYKKAWIEYELRTGRWYSLSSPLQNTFAGEWYSPTDGGRQVTPHFYGIKYSHSDNHRFQPAYYQRSWDNAGNNPVYLKAGGDINAYIKADWSQVYNDVTKEYSEGGFSVKASDQHMTNKPADSKVLVRMPKADTQYTYYDINNETGSKKDDVLNITQDRYRLWSDKVRNGATFSQTISNKTEDNNFFLVGNPFMANMDMDAFFDANTDLEKKFWIMTDEGQKVSVKVDGNLWIGTDGSVGRTAPLQGFFVKGKGNTTTVTFSALMQKDSENGGGTPPVHGVRAAGSVQPVGIDLVRLTAERNGDKSTAVIMLSDNAEDGYVAGEDCEVFIDADLYNRPTVYTSADAMAQTINVRRTLLMVPVGIISADDSEAMLTFDLSSHASDMLYLYDCESDSYTEIEDGTTVTMSGNNSGRYYLTTSVKDLDSAIDNELEQRKGVWTVSGIYMGKTILGLQPGVYVVDGAKMLIK